MTRSTADLISLVDLFNEYDCAFNSLTESIDTQSATGRMFIKIIGIFAEFERENMAERVRLGFERKVREGYSLCSNIASYGYNRKKGEKIQTVNEQEAVIVKEIFDMFINQNMPYHGIAKNLNSRHIPSKENSIWWARTIKDLLTNCNYVGKVRYGTEDKNKYFETKGMHRAIITDEIYNQAQELIKKTEVKVYKKHPKEEHYFSGSLFCGACGGKLMVHGTYRNRDKDNVLYGRYRCYNAILKSCNESSVRHIMVEKAFIEYINRIGEADIIDEIQLSAREHIKTQNQELASNLHKEISKLERRESELIKRYIDGNAEYDDYIQLKRTIEAEKQRVSSTLATVENFVDEEVTIKRENIIKSLQENWELLTNAEKRQFLISFVEKIVLVNEVQKGKRNGEVKIFDMEFSTD